MPALSACPGCGLELPPSNGPTHAYIGASPACWALYGELLASQYARYEAGAHRMTVDAYAVQHPGVPERRTIRSVALHLTRLCLMLERGVPGEDAARLMVLVGEHAPMRWLDPPEPNGSLTVREVLGGEATVEAWANDVWAAWAPHHDTVRGWVTNLAGGTRPSG